MGRKIVAKFGGSSVADSECIGRVVEIVKGVKGVMAVVVSATAGTTDLLIRLGEEVATQGSWERTFDELKKKHQKIVEELVVEIDLEIFWKEIAAVLKEISVLGEFNARLHDKLVNFGERISSNIVAAAANKAGLQAVAVNAFEIVFADNEFKNANVHFKKTDSEVRKKLSELEKKGVMPIITGFIAQSEQGDYVTLGRGGSDYTAALVAAAVDATELQIWTDVDGVYNADPRVVKKAGPLKQIAFEEASELAYFGAKVLHPKTIQPAIEKDIPVRVLNTFNPEAKGTVVDRQKTATIKAVTSKKGVNVVNICSTRMLNAYGFLAKVFEVFDKHKVVVDMLATSEVSVSVSVDCKPPKALLDELGEFSKVRVYRDLAAICVVGNEICEDKKILAAIFGKLKKYKIVMVSQGASQRNIAFLVENKFADEVVRSLFNSLF